MRSAPASLLLHRGHGSRHVDLVLGAGLRCPTLSCDLRQHRGGWNLPHRRRYLTYAGPLTGDRGQVERLWRGRVVWHRIPRGWCFRLHAAGGSGVMRPMGMGILAVRGSRVVCRGWPAKLR